MNAGGTEVHGRIIAPTKSAYRFPLLIKQLLLAAMRNHSDQEIVYRDLRRMTYREFNGRLGQLANALKAVGVKPGDVVGVMDWDSHRYLECYFAVPMMGSVLQTVNVRLSPEQIFYTLNHAGPTTLLINEEFLPLYESIKADLKTVERVVLLTDKTEVGALPGGVVAEYESLLAKQSTAYDFPDFDENTCATLFYTTGTTARRPPLLIFNGIGANLELAFPFMRALEDSEAIIFDVPGVGGSPAPMTPYRPSTIARLARDLALKLNLGQQLDVAGVSWGGGLAQQFARQYPQICRRLVLMATAPGVTMLPGNPSVILKMASPRRYSDRGYMRKIAADIYGGVFRKDPALIHRHAEAMKGATRYGYFLQLAAMTGWTSIHWLHALNQPTLILAGTDDPLVPAFNARVLARLIPNSHLELIDNGHFFVVSHPEETARTVEKFLSRDDL